MWEHVLLTFFFILNSETFLVRTVIVVDLVAVLFVFWKTIRYVCLFLFIYFIDYYVLDKSINFSGMLSNSYSKMCLMSSAY